MEADLLIQEAQALIAGENSYIANLSNLSACLNQALDQINWVGFYLYEAKTDQLVLGPFQGKPACLRIDMNKGVCGTAFGQNKILRVPDVHQFEGHIACDPASQSEIVLPIHLSNGIRGVLDIDSPILDRFSLQDQEVLEQIVAILNHHPHGD